MADQTSRARALFAGAQEAVASAPGRVRPGIRLAIVAYGRILDRAERAGFDVLGRAVGLRPWHVPGVLARAAVRR
jgi:phytoene/squalene synthetase